MKKIPTSFCILAILLFLVPVSTIAQIKIWTDQGLAQRIGEPPVMLDIRTSEPDTISITAESPFFDDFPYEDVLPDTNKWFIRDIDFRVPRVVRNAAINPPSMGTLRFDGLKRDGIPYETLLPTSGLTDRLLSHYLDLSGFDPADNLTLYLYVEAGGRSESPESTDSFRVYLNTVSDTFLLASVGGDVPNGQTWISVPITRAEYFSKLSQIVLESEGSQNGLLDVWLVDYIYLGKEWPGGIGSLEDQALIRLESSPVEPYFALPAKLYQQAVGWQSPYEISARQNASTPFNGSIYTEWSNPASSPVSPFFSTLNVQIPGNSTELIFSPAQAPQIPEGFERWTSLNYLVGNTDRTPDNDTLRTFVPVDSLIGYDDGEPDNVIGLNKPLSLGIRFDLPSPDTVSAVWMHFSPLLFVNGVNGKITYLEGKAFRFRIWNYPHPDSFIVEQVVNMNVTYGVEGEYIRLELTDPKAVPATFWAGFQQLDEIPIGLGLDSSYDRDAWTYRDSLGYWVNTRVDGAPMIRIELLTNAGSPLASNDPPVFSDLSHSPSLLGNRIHKGTSLRIHNLFGHTTYKGSLLDQRGRSLFAVERIRPSDELHVEIPWEVSEGLYIWRHEWRVNGQTYIHSERLLLHP